MSSSPHYKGNSKWLKKLIEDNIIIKTKRLEIWIYKLLDKEELSKLLNSGEGIIEGDIHIFVYIKIKTNMYFKNHIK